MSRTAACGDSVLTLPANLLHCKMKPGPSLPEDAIQSSASRSLSPFPSYPISFQGTSNIFPALDVLLTSPNGQGYDYHGYRAESARILAPIPHRILPYVDHSSLGYVQDGSRSAPHWPMEKELTQSASPHYMSTWLYSRDPLHDRYPDFSKFFFPTLSDTFHDAAGFLELQTMAMLPMMDSATGSPISLSVLVRASFAKLFLTRAPQAEQTSDVA